MESILLGALALVGFSQNTKKDNIVEKKNNMQSIMYNTNTFNQMKNVEQKQAQELRKSVVENKPEFYKQFDELKFDNMDLPVSIMDSHKTYDGVNKNLQRNIDLNMGYSNLNENLNFGVVDKNEFTHNNMTPNSSKRDYSINNEKSSRRLEAFTGVSDMWVPKQEKYNLFEPMKNLTYGATNGMPSITDYLDDRYLPSNKNNNGNLPFQNNVMVQPGIDGKVREGLYGTYRINPRTVDDLRSEINQKITYNNKPLETIKKGEMRAPDPSLTKFKVPDFRIISTNELVQGKSIVDGMKKTGKIDISTDRGLCNTYYVTPATNSNMGDGPDKNKTSFEPSFRVENHNDPTHAINAVNVRPVFLNEQSFSNVMTQRASMPAVQTGPMTSSTSGSYAYSDNYIPETTIRETTSHSKITGEKASVNANNLMLSDKAKTTTRETTSHSRTTGEKASVTANNLMLSDKAKTTIKETTSHNIVTGGMSSVHSSNVLPTDKAKQTIKETTSHNIVTGGMSSVYSGNVIPMDKAKKTIKETTSHNIVTGGMSSVYSGNVMPTDKAKKTIKETTSHNIVTGGMSSVYSGNVIPTDKAKKTIKETTSHNIVTGGMSSVHSSNVLPTDKAKTTIKETTSHNIITGMGSSLYIGNVMPTDEMKTTVKETTLYSTPGMNFASNIISGYTIDYEDVAKPTIKQTTENTIYQGSLYGSENHSGYTRDLNDNARTTIKETTLLQDYKGGCSVNVMNPTSHLSADNMTIDDRREILTYNRPADGGKNISGPQINKKTVRMNQRKDSVFYMGGPRMALDNSISPSVSLPYKNGEFIDKKPQLSYGNYYTNNDYISAVKDNPLVNNLVYQHNSDEQI